MPINQLLNNLVVLLEDKGTSMQPYLQPGLSRYEIVKAFSKLNLTPPDEIIELYEWHNGVNDVINTPELLFGEHQFLPLDIAVQEYYEITKNYNQALFSVELSQCFPFSTYSGDSNAIYCKEMPISNLYHPIINIYHGISISFENMEQMIRTVIEWFASGIYDFEPVNDVLRTTIRQNLNPRIPEIDTTL